MAERAPSAVGPGMTKTGRPDTTTRRHRNATRPQPMPRTVAERADILPTLGELFREHGYEGASLTLISQRTGLGKGSLYHFFPGGKQEMAAAVLAEIDGWFETNIFAPLRDSPEPKTAIADMLTATDTYFHSGRRLCLIG